MSTLNLSMPRETIPELDVIADYGCEIGENPLWHPAEQKLYWTDIPTGRLFRFDPASGTDEQIYSGRPVGGFTFQRQGGLLLFRDRGNIALWKEGELSELIYEIPGETNSRFNDVIADPMGRVYCGTVSSAEAGGRLYRLEKDGALITIADNVGCSNGMGFTPDGKGFYYTDSYAREIYLFDYSPATGELSNKRVFAVLPESWGLPDGLTVDIEGGVWSAVWDGSALLRFESSGVISHCIRLPAKKVSSAAFGGPDLRDLFITTAGGNTKHEDGSLAGSLLRIRTEVPGRPEFFSEIAIASY